MSQDHVIVIGAGVLGLTCALELIRKGYAITIIARDLPGSLALNYASPWAGAHFRPVPGREPSDRLEQALTKETYDALKTIAASEPVAGVEFVEGREYFDAPSKVHTDLDPEMAFTSWPGFRVLKQHQLLGEGRGTITWGVSYNAWIINSPAYLLWLLEEILNDKPRIIQSEVASVQEAVHLVREEVGPPGMVFHAVINATGMGIQDPEAYPSRGQFLLVSNQFSSTISHHRKDGTSTVVVPRPLGGGTLIGGSKEVENWSPYPNSTTTAIILERVTELCPEMVKDGPLKLLRVNVGRRPMRRGGLRLEREDVKLVETAADGLKSRSMPLRVIHCYGAGGSGYKVSWGAAHKVVELVDGLTVE